MSNTLKANEYNAYYSPYVMPVKDAPLLELLSNSLDTTVAFFHSLNKDKLEYTYAPGKWTPKEILQHLIDTERVFSYRALFIARAIHTDLKGFDQDEFAETVQANQFTRESLLEDYIAVRKASITLFKSFSSETLLRIGKASGSDISVRACGYILCGHEKHHCQIINERYL
ncbi:DinB family protein [Jejudonia soesokkakensis]|uniref:DinB family protein n=1 Tax=Jejudonia soesokkakensis TaxID=1323432 RepID=A0ABW2MTQ8_9FLAO